MDHDRQSGEGVAPQEYVLIKLQVTETGIREKMPELLGKKVSLVAATLRPETMYGQTNCWVGTDIEYGAFLIHQSEVKEEEVFVCTERAAKNLAFQGYNGSKGFGHVECLAKYKGEKLLGLPLLAPMSLNGKGKSGLNNGSEEATGNNLTCDLKTCYK